MKYFFDNNLSPKLAKAINNLVWPEDQVVHLREKFRADIADVDWMKNLASEDKWIIVTADIHISRNPHEIKAWEESGHVIFFLAPAWIKGATFWTQAEKLVHYFPNIRSISEKAKPGSSYLVPIKGTIRSCLD